MTLLGYNLYCDGQQVNTSLITETTYTLTDAADGEYTATAVYSIGESEPSNSVTVSVSTGIAETMSYELRTMNYYDLQGRRIEKPIEGRIYLYNGRKTVYEGHNNY